MDRPRHPSCYSNLVAYGAYGSLCIRLTLTNIGGQILNTKLYTLLYSLLIAVYMYSKCTSVLWGEWPIVFAVPPPTNDSPESVIVIPSFGLQYETQRGLPGIPLLTSRHFIPLTYLQDFVINEGLHGWNVRYYLAALEQSPLDTISLHVPYQVCYLRIAYKAFTESSSEHTTPLSSSTGSLPGSSRNGVPSPSQQINRRAVPVTENMTNYNRYEHKTYLNT